MGVPIINLDETLTFKLSREIEKGRGPNRWIEDFSVRERGLAWKSPFEKAKAFKLSQ